MRLRATAGRVLRVGVISVVALLLLAFVLVQWQQWLLRHRAERLLADFRSIRLRQSTWADAQRLVSRWGKWGHYEGVCNATNCGYTVMLSNEVQPPLSELLFEKLPRHLTEPLFRLFTDFGGQFATMQLSFLVQDGVIVRSSVGLRISVPPHKLRKDDENGYGLLLSGRASASLHSATPGVGILGDDEQLAEHPFYKAGRPSGCEICMAVRVTYTPYTPQEQITEITSYDLSCLTRFRPCLTLPDVLPAARAWHLYPSVERDASPPEPSGPPRPCDIPVFALARDADEVLHVRVISTSAEHEPPSADYPAGREHEHAQVEVVSAPKAPSAQISSRLELAPYAYDFNFPSHAAEKLEVGGKYIVFLRSEIWYPDLHMDRCGEVPDTPEMSAQVQQGLAQNDALRRSEGFGQFSW